MSLDIQMARVTAGTDWKVEASISGIPEIVRSDVLAALGYASGYVPDSDTGVHLMLAKYTDCPNSRDALYRAIPAVSWELWWKHKRDGNTNRQIHIRIAQLAINDTCTDKRIQAGGAKFMGQFCNVDWRIWKQRYAQHYGNLMSWLSVEEAPVFRATYRALFYNGF